jgi:hypothetical protein
MPDWENRISFGSDELLKHTTTAILFCVDRAFSLHQTMLYGAICPQSVGCRVFNNYEKRVLNAFVSNKIFFKAKGKCHSKLACCTAQVSGAPNRRRRHYHPNNIISCCYITYCIFVVIFYSNNTNFVVLTSSTYSR